MSDQQHTPGPWELDRSGVVGWENGRVRAIAVMKWNGDTGTPVAWVHPYQYLGDSTPDAHLIAAAPDLYAAVKSVLDWFAAIDAEQWARTGPTQTLESASRNWDLPSEVPSLDMAPLQAAIAKAEGRS